MPKKGGLGQFANLGGRLGKKEGMVFLREVDSPMHSLWRGGGEGGRGLTQKLYPGTLLRHINVLG